MAEFVPPTLQLTKITHSIYTYFLSYFLIIYSNNFFLPAFIPYIVSELHAIHFFNNKQIHANVIDRSMMDKTAERLCSNNWWAKIQEWFELEALFQFKTIERHHRIICGLFTGTPLLLSVFTLFTWSDLQKDWTLCKKH